MKNMNIVNECSESIKINVTSAKLFIGFSLCIFIMYPGKSQERQYIIAGMYRL